MNWDTILIPKLLEDKGLEFPDIDPHLLWNLNASEFNNWRRQFDFPRIVQFLREETSKI